MARTNTFRTDALARRRVGEIRALAATATEADLDVLVADLNDPRKQVARAAREVLADRLVVPRERLWTLLAATPWAHTRSQVVALLARGERVDSITWLLNACALGDDAVCAQAARYLDQWGDHWQPIEKFRLVTLVAALRRAERRLPPRLARRLWEYVRHAGGELRAASGPVAPWLATWTPASAADQPGVNGVFSGRVVLRSYELPPRWRRPWELLISR